MARSVPYKHQISEVVNWNQTKALNETLFILREIGPVGFIVQEEGKEKKYKVCLGDPHNCTCKDFKKDKDLCKHICWILLKKYKLDRNDPISWQLGLVQREIDDLIFSKKNTINKVFKINTDSSVNESDDKIVLQRKIESNDICPICQEDFLNVHKPVTYCRHGCGNNVHIRCMSVWTDHKKKELNLTMQDSIPCPICRGEFGTLHVLLLEMTNSKDTNLKTKKPVVSLKYTGFICSNCNISPINGKVYKCTCCSYYCLCVLCFNNNIHDQHSFLFRESSNCKWSDAPSSRILPLSVINGLQNNEIESSDYNILQNVDKPSKGSCLRQQDINRFPSWIIINKSKLSQPGHQCRICLMSYKEGDSVRKLPCCQHIFHTLCIDQWLLHRSPHCPLDNIEVPKIGCKNRTQNTLILPISKNQLIEDNHGFIRQSQDLLSSLSIAPMGSRQSSSSNGGIDHRGYFHNFSRSANNKPHHLPPIIKHKQDINASLSIKSMRLHHNSLD